MRRQRAIDRQRAYYNERSGEMTKNDHQIAKKYADKTKKRYINKIEKQKK
ncbi:MAG: hypothetical protein IJW43_01535 [Clostridia bacterium]|nr:hypothetical protein [Clostridia bacterium]